MKKLLFLLLLFQPALAAPPTTRLLRQFTRALLDKQVPDSVLIARYMCPDLLLQRGDPRVDKARAELRYCRSEYQKQWQLSPQQLRQARITPSRPALHPGFHLLGGEADTYVVQVKGHPSLYLLAPNQRIASFLLLNQGGEAYFLDFCH